MNDFYSQFAIYVHDLHDYKLWNTARWQGPAFDKVSDLRVTHLWPSCETIQHRAQGSFNSFIFKYAQLNDNDNYNDEISIAK